MKDATRPVDITDDSEDSASDNGDAYARPALDRPSREPPHTTFAVVTTKKRNRAAARSVRAARHSRPPVPIDLEARPAPCPHSRRYDALAATCTQCIEARGHTIKITRIDLGRTTIEIDEGALGRLRTMREEVQ